MNATEMALVEHMSRVLYDNTVVIGSSSLGYGIFFVIFVIALMDTMQRSQESGPARFLSIVITLHGILYSTFYALNFSGTLLLLTWPDISSPEDDLRRRLDKGNQVHNIVTPSLIMILPFIYIIADSTALWRSWVLWPGSPLARWLLIIVGFVNAIVALSCGIYGVVTGESRGVEDPDYRAFYYSQILVSVTTNALATTLIAIKAWKHWDAIRQTSSVKLSPSLRVMTLLIEGGFILCVFQIVQPLVGLPAIHGAPEASTAQQVLSAFGDNFAAMYPLLVVTILARNRSIFANNVVFSGSPGSGSDGRPNGIGTRISALRFATGPSDLSTTRSAEVASAVQDVPKPSSVEEKAAAVV